MYPREYLDYLIYFHAQRDYFECHEVLEEYWKEEEVKRKVWVGLIQIAVSLYHQRRHNYTGSLKMMESALKIIHEEKEEIVSLGLDYNKLLLQIEERIHDIKSLTPYQSLNLPLKDDVIQLCQGMCESQGLAWGKASDLKDNYLINKHSLRDRSEVIKERQINHDLRKRNSCK